MGFNSNDSEGILFDNIVWMPNECSRDPTEYNPNEHNPNEHNPNEHNPNEHSSNEDNLIYQTPLTMCSRFKESYKIKNPLNQY
jgi:hypothetical protein